MTFRDDAVAHLAADERLRAMAASANVRLALVAGGDRLAVRVASGDVTGADDVDFSLEADASLWREILAEHPVPGMQHFLPQIRSGQMHLVGDQRVFERHLHVVRRVIEVLRPAEGKAGAAEPRALTMRGEYVRIDTRLGQADVYVERAGAGPQLLCLPTAGSDTTQFHGLVTDTDITDRFEVIAFDLPWHGKSAPPRGADPMRYSLTPAEYTDIIVAVADALGLERPILLGASMAGAAVVRAIAMHGHRFAGAVSCQAAVDVAGRATPAARATDVDQSLFPPEWTYGLMNPASPGEHRDRVWWGYSSGAHGVYIGDIDGYQQWRFDEVADLLTPQSPHIAVLTGVFDTSVPPERSEELASRIPNSSFQRMDRLGHFPHAENPEEFWRMLEPALVRITG